MKFLFIVLMWSIPIITFGQVVEAPLMESSEFFEILIKSLGGMKGASTLGIVAIVVKLLLAFMNSKLFGKAFKGLKGSMKLLIVLALSMISGVVGLMMSTDISFGAAMLHSTTMSAFLVLANQIYKQFVEKKD